MWKRSLSFCLSRRLYARAGCLRPTSAWPISAWPTSVSPLTRFSSTCVCGFVQCLSVCPAGMQWEDDKSADSLAPYVGSSMSAVDAAFDLCELQAADTLLDIGSGDGRILIRGVERVACFAVGVELNRVAYELGVEHTAVAFQNSSTLRSKIRLIHGSYLDLTPACLGFGLSASMAPTHQRRLVITCFLLPQGLVAINDWLDKNTHFSSFHKVVVITIGWPLPTKSRFHLLATRVVPSSGTSISLYEIKS